MPGAARYSQRRTAIAIVSLLAAAACGSDDVTGLDDEDVVGRYDLLTVDDVPLPFVVVAAENETVEILTGSIELRTDGVALWGFTVRVTTGGVPRSDMLSLTGTWATSGSTLDLVWDNGCADGATWSEGRLTLTSDCPRAEWEPHGFTHEKQKG